MVPQSNPLLGENSADNASGGRLPGKTHHRRPGTISAIASQRPTTFLWLVYLLLNKPHRFVGEDGDFLSFRSGVTTPYRVVVATLVNNAHVDADISPAYFPLSFNTAKKSCSLY